MSTLDYIATILVQIGMTFFIVSFIMTFVWVLRFCKKFKQEYEQYKEKLEQMENRSPKPEANIKFKHKSLGSRKSQKSVKEVKENFVEGYAELQEE